MDGKICIAGLIETPEMRRTGGLFSQGSRNSAARVFKGAIANVCDSITVETVNGYYVCIKGILNNSRMRENAFSEEVCESFMDGFPVQWSKLIESNMEHLDGHSQSPSNSTDDALVEHYLEKFMSDSFVSSKGYSFAKNNFSSFQNLASSDLGEPGTPKGHKTSVNLRTENTPAVPAVGMTPPSGAVQASQKNEDRTLRSGRVLRGPISAPVTGGKRWKRMHHKESDHKELKNKEVSPTRDLTSNENGCSVAGIVAEDKLQSHDSHSKGKRKPTKRNRYRETKKLFWNFM